MKKTLPTQACLLAASVALAAAAPTPAHAQNAMGNGHALDANLQKGTGGYNQAAPTIDYNARNNVITGNVPGLSAFHGTVGYRGVGQLGTTTAEDSFFPFNAASYPVSPSASSPGVTGSPVSVFRSEDPTLASQVPQLSSYNALLQPRIASPGSWTAAPISQSFSSNNYFKPQALGTVHQADGRTLEINASPLLGLRTEDATHHSSLGDPNNPQSQAWLLPTTLEDQDQLSPSDTGTPGNPGNPENPSTPGTADNGQTNNPRGRSSTQLLPAMELGDQLQQARLDSNSATDNTTRLDQRIAQLQAALFSPLGSGSAAPGDDAYLDLLRQIKNNRDLAAGKQPETPSPLAPQPKPTTPDNSNSTTPTPTTPPPGVTREHRGVDDTTPPDAEPALAPPTADQLRQAREARLHAMRVARGLPDSPATGGQTATGVPSASEKSDNAADEAAADNTPIRGRLGAMVGSLKYDLPPLTTLAGAHQDRLNDLLRQAEVDMKAGKYFDAEAKYRLALEFTPGQPLATIGLIHSQIGAGLARSAAMNLRRLFEQHPEVIAARYDAHLLPHADRLERARRELEDMIRTTGQADPALLLAYLGYQTHSPDLLRYGLDLSQARAPRDPLNLLLRRIWLASAAMPAPAAGSTTAPAPAPGSDIEPVPGRTPSGGGGGANGTGPGVAPRTVPGLQTK